MPLSVEKEIFWLDIPMGDTLGMQVPDTVEYLLEATLDFAGTHATFLDSSVEVTARTKLHDLAPFLVLILHQVDGLDDVDVMQCRGDAEFRGELLDVFLL